ncbi:MAG: hypothetical protein QW794_00350 [Thermosphaera sp.]
MKWDVIVEPEERTWAEPIVVRMYVADWHGSIFKVVKWYAAGNVIIECCETDEDLSREGKCIGEEKDLIEYLISIVKHEIEWHINHTCDFIASIKVNDSRVFERLKETINELKTQFPK